jgi:predicted metalloprotease
LLVAVTAAQPKVSPAVPVELSAPETLTFPGLAGRSLTRRQESAARALPLEAVGSLDSALSRKAVIERTRRIVEQGRRRQILLIAASVVVIAGVLIGTLRYAARADAAAQPNTAWNQIVTSTPSGAASVSSPASASTASASAVSTTAPAVSTTPTTAASLPTTASTAMTTLTKNAIYAQSVAVGSCPPMVKPNNNAEAQQAISRYVDCMNDVWGKILAASSRPFRGASVEFFTDVVESPCDKYDPSTTNAVYCMNNMTLYVSGSALGKATKDRAYAAELVTHEYAHHVQSLSGIINAAYQVWGQTDEYSRRIEMHAHCLSFALISHVPGFGVTPGDLGQFRNGWSRGPDNAKFGSIASQQAYGEKGLAATKVGDCEAFSAPTVS